MLTNTSEQLSGVMTRKVSTSDTPNPEVNQPNKRKRKRDLDQSESGGTTKLFESTHGTGSPKSSPRTTPSTRGHHALHPTTPRTSKPYVYGATFTHSSRTRRPNISEDDGMFILSHVIREFDRLPLNVSVKKLPMTFWHSPLKSWNRRLVRKQLPPASSEETVRTFYYNNLKTYRGICNMLRVPGWHFNDEIMELTPPQSVDREELYMPEGKKTRGLIKRFPYMKHFRILEVLIENRDQGTVKDLDTIMTEIGVGNPSDLDYDSEGSVDTNSDNAQPILQEEEDVYANNHHANQAEEASSRKICEPTSVFQSDGNETGNLQLSPPNTTEEVDVKRAEENTICMTSQSRDSVTPLPFSKFGSLSSDNPSPYERHVSKYSSARQPLVLQPPIPIRQSFNQTSYEDDSFAHYPILGMPLNQNQSDSFQGMTLPPPSQLVGSTAHSSLQNTSPSVLRPRPTVFSSFVLHAKARLHHSRDLSIVLRALFASDSRYLLYQIISDSTAVAAEAAHAEGLDSIAPEHMDEILLLVLEISREIAKENNWQQDHSSKPLSAALSAVSSVDAEAGHEQGKTRGAEEASDLGSGGDYAKTNSSPPTFQCADSGPTTVDVHNPTKQNGEGFEKTEKSVFSVSQLTDTVFEKESERVDENDAQKGYQLGIDRKTVSESLSTPKSGSNTVHSLNGFTAFSSLNAKPGAGSRRMSLVQISGDVSK